MSQVSLNFPDSTYTSSSKPVCDTLKADLSAIETAYNAHDIAATDVHGITGTLVGTSETQTLINKTLTSPVLNTGVSGSAVLDEDAMGSDSATKVATQQSIKAYIDAKTRTRSIFLSASMFQSVEGSPNFADTDNTGGYWALDDATTERVGANIIVPSDYASGTINAYIYYSTITGNAGDVVLRVRQSNFAAEDADCITGVSDESLTDTVIATAKDLNITAAYTLNIGSIAVGNMMSLSCGRIGGEGADTVSGNIVFLGLKIEYTAN